jgi:ParB family transcriptional regulator, chromosome partitioning protein
MSLVENIARRPPSNLDLVREVRTLLERKYAPEEIARKLGLDRTYIYGIINLVEHGEEMLIAAVEGGRLPISVAIEIAKGATHEMQLALSEAYEKGDLRGTKLLAAKRIISKRISKQQQVGKSASGHKRLTSDALVREYRRRIREQQSLIKKANRIKDRLLLLTSAMRTLLSDEHFITLLRAENIADMPEQLASRLK